MNCPHCGTSNSEEATTCRECGRLLPKAAPSAQGPAPTAGLGTEDEETLGSPTVESAPGRGRSPAPAVDPAGTPVKTADTAIASLICGILSWSFLPFAGAVVAVILGHMAKADIRQSEGRLGGDSLATLGLLLGYANLAIAALGIILLVFLVVLGITIPLGIGICSAFGA
jgi:hypothetical protein